MSKAIPRTMIILLVFFAGAVAWPFLVGICNRNTEASAVEYDVSSAIAPNTGRIGNDALEGSLRWVREESVPDDKGHLEYYEGDDWINLEKLRERPVWGQGELPVDHQEFFGNDNTARLDYVQNRVLDRHGAILKEIAIRVLALEAVDPNTMRLEALESGMEKLTLVGSDKKRKTPGG